MNDQVYACCNNIRSRTFLSAGHRNKQFWTWGAVYGTVKFDTSIGLACRIKVYCLYLFLFLFCSCVSIQGNHNVYNIIYD